jgi:hypothetical protein
MLELRREQAGRGHRRQVSAASSLLRIVLLIVTQNVDYLVREGRDSVPFLAQHVLVPCQANGSRLEIRYRGMQFEDVDDSRVLQLAQDPTKVLADGGTIGIVGQ